jgi:hypothetical protein
MYEYRMTVIFTTSRELTEKEISDLEVPVWAQIEEPQVDTDELQGWTDADYETSSIRVNTEMTFCPAPTA